MAEYIFNGSTSSANWKFRLVLQDENAGARTSVRRLIPQISRPVGNSTQPFYNANGITITLRLGGVEHKYTVSQPKISVVPGNWYNLALPSGWDSNESSIRFTATKDGGVKNVYCHVVTGISPATMDVNTNWTIEYIAPPPSGPPLPGTPFITATGYVDRIELKWGAASNAAYYNIYRQLGRYDSNTFGDLQLIASGLTGLSYTDYHIASAAPGTKYYYTIRAGNVTGLSYGNGTDIYTRPGGVWIEGKYATPYVKTDNGTWVQAKDVYVKNAQGLWVSTKY